MGSPLQSPLIDLIEDRYVLTERIPQISAALSCSGDVHDQDPPEVVAARLTRSLRNGSDDLHLRVKVRSTATDCTHAEGFDARMEHEARANAGGIRTVTRLDAATAVLEIAPYLSEVHLCSGFIDAAFALVTGVERLIIDVRSGVGGTPGSVAHLCGYLLGDQPVHLQDVVERDGTSQQFCSRPARGRLGEDVRVVVLISARTFSGCEELAYDLQALGRARVIGERTRGGAHPVRAFPLTDVLEVLITVARSVNATTGSNLEGCGVTPDVETSAADALSRALANLSSGCHDED